jgi:hypothetical protein
MGNRDDQDDDIPLLEDIVRPGSGPSPKDEQGRPTLTESEIEAIAARVVERHSARIEQAVARAIRTALDMKARQQQGDSGSGG